MPSREPASRSDRREIIQVLASSHHRRAAILPQNSDIVILQSNTLALAFSIGRKTGAPACVITIDVPLAKDLPWLVTQIEGVQPDPDPRRIEASTLPTSDEMAFYFSLRADGSTAFAGATTAFNASA